MTDNEYNRQMAAQDMRTAPQFLATLVTTVGGMLLIGWLA